jgi:preprotein translocase subunit SecE
MGRLKRKRPASTKKKGRTRAAQKNSGQPAIAREAVAQGAALTRSEPKSVVSGKEGPKPIRPSGRKIQLPFWPKTAQFLREVRIELKKVTWPSRKEAMASTVVVIILVIIVSAFLGVVDVGLSSLIRLVLH